MSQDPNAVGGEVFEKAMNELPSCANHDQVRDISHAVFRAQHEIDMIREGEVWIASTQRQQEEAEYEGYPWISRKQFNACKRFIKKWNKAEYNVEGSEELPWDPYLMEKRMGIKVSEKYTS